MLRQSGESVLLSLPPGQIGKAEAVAPLHQLAAGRGQLPQGSHRPVAAPHHRPVCQICQPSQGGGVPGWDLEGVEEGGQTGLLLRQQLKDGQGEPLVPGGQLHQIDIAGEQALHCAEGGQAVYIAGGDMEQGAQRNGLGAAEGPLLKGVERDAQLHGQLVFQGLPPEQGADVRHLPAPAGTGVPEDERVQLSPVQPLPHSLEGGDDGLRLQGPAGAGLIDRLLQLIQHLGQLAVREQASVGEDQNPSPFPSRSAAPAAQVLMSPRPTRPSRVR